MQRCRGMRVFERMPRHRGSLDEIAWGVGGKAFEGNRQRVCRWLAGRLRGARAGHRSDALPVQPDRPRLSAAADVAELADALGSGPSGGKTPWRFEPSHPHWLRQFLSHLQRSTQRPRFGHNGLAVVQRRLIQESCGKDTRRVRFLVASVQNDRCPISSSLVMLSS